MSLTRCAVLYREIRNIFSDLQNIFGLSLFDFRTEVFELFVLF